MLAALEQLAERDLLDLYYGDEGRGSLEPCVPYGGQLPDEQVFVPASQRAGENGFALLSRAAKLVFATTRLSITSAFLLEDLERWSFAIQKMMVVVLDNARVPPSQEFQERRVYGQQRGLYRFSCHRIRRI